MVKVLYLEDDVDYANMLISSIDSSTYDFTHIETVDELDNFENIHYFDLILSDLYVEGLSHLELLDKLDQFNIPIIIISNSTDTKDELTVFSRNIQEYISKTSIAEVIKLRMDKVLENYTTKNLTYISKGKEYFLVDESNVVIDHEGEVIFLSPREYKILKYLLKHAGEIIERKELYYCAFYKEINESEQRVVDVYITRIRKKLNVIQIRSIRGIGYSWQE